MICQQHKETPERKLGPTPWLVESFVYEAINSDNQISHGDGSPTARELQITPKDLQDKFQPSPNRPQRKRKSWCAIGLFKQGALLGLNYWPPDHGSHFVF